MARAQYFLFKPEVCTSYDNPKVPLYLAVHQVKVWSQERNPNRTVLAVLGKRPGYRVSPHDGHSPVRICDPDAKLLNKIDTTSLFHNMFHKDRFVLIRAKCAT